MQIPSNYSEQEVIDIITKVVKKIAPKYTFGFYSLEDIQQEAFMIAIKDCLPLYDEVRPLENFLSVVLNNKMKNFKRDNYFRKDSGSAEQIQNVKRKLIEPNSIDNCKIAENDGSDFLEELYLRELMEKIDNKLSPKLRADYLRLRSGVTLSKSKKQRIFEAIKEILNEEG